MPRVRPKPDPPSCGPPPPRQPPLAQVTAMESSSGASAYSWSPYPEQQTKDYLRMLPGSLSLPDKMAALTWQETCFCCSSQLSLAHTYLAFSKSFIPKMDTRKVDTEVLGHWALNLLKFLNTNPQLACTLLLKMDLMSLLSRQLDNTADVRESANGFKLPIDPLFAQQFSCPRQLPFLSTLQVAFVDVMSSLTTTAEGARSLITNTAVSSVLLLCLRTARDDRFLACSLQMLWQIFQDAEELGLSEAELEALAAALLEGGVLPVLCRALTTSRNANVLKAAASLAYSVMLTQPFQSFGYLGPDRPAPGLRCGGRALVAAQEAGLERALSGVLSLQPSGLTFWININFAVMGAAYMELQALTLGVLRALLQAATAAGRPCGKDFASSAVVAAWLDRKGGPPSGEDVDEEQLGAPTAAAAASSSGSGSDPSGAATAQAAASASSPAAQPAASAAAPPVATAPVGGSANGGGGGGGGASGAKGKGGKGKAKGKGAEAPPIAAVDLTNGGSSSGTDGAAGSGEEAQPRIPPERAEAVVVAMMSRLDANVTASGEPLASMDPRERNLTPDFRFLQIQKIRRATEAARQAAAGANANRAVDFLSRAMAATQL